MIEWIFGGILALCVLVFIAASIGIVIESKNEQAERKRLITQCLADGKKEYECKSLFRRSESTIVPVPIVIPVR